MSESRWTLLVSAGVITMGALPAFLVGVYAVDFKAEFGIGDALVGVLLAAYFGTSAALSAQAGRIVERVGARAGMAISLIGVSASMALVAAFGRRFVAVAALLMLSAACHAASHPASNLALVEVVSQRRRGLAFGIKQAAIPAATFLAGLTVPAFGARYGWRAAFALLPLVGAALLTLLLAFVPPTRAPLGPGRGERGHASPALRRLALAVALSIAGIQPVGVFFVAWGGAEGLSPSVLASILSAVGLAGIGVRILAGWTVDRRDAEALIPSVAVFIAVGAMGVGLLAVASGYVLASVGVAVAVVIGWSWNGLFHYAVVKHHPAAPAYASSVTQGGLFVGVALGPLAFGLVAEYLSYSAAWLMSTLLMVCGAAVMADSWRLLRGRPALASDGGPRPGMTPRSGAGKGRSR